MEKGEQYMPNFNVFNRHWWKRDLGLMPILSRIMDDVVKFFLEVVLFPALLFLLTYCIS